MFREASTTASGGGFSRAQILVIWAKGRVIQGSDPALARMDACGAVMHFDQYGHTGIFGWEVDHLIPVALGGDDEFSNLRPLQWRNNRAKGDRLFGWEVAATRDSQVAELCRRLRQLWTRRPR